MAFLPCDLRLTLSTFAVDLRKSLYERDRVRGGTWDSSAQRQPTLNGLVQRGDEVSVLHDASRQLVVMLFRNWRQRELTSP